MPRNDARRALARELGLTEMRVSQLQRIGMPVDSAHAAREWRAANIKNAEQRDRWHAETARGEPL